jgi:hypothetical protein
MQAYKEIVDDGHPVIVVCARDIVALLREAGYATVDHLQKWLDSIDPWSESADILSEDSQQRLARG